MNVEELSMIGPNVDLETVDAINKKRLLAFVNHYVVNTTLFLNKLSKSYETGLMRLETKIQKLETSIVMLESKLSSVPGLEDKVEGSEAATKREETVVAAGEGPKSEDKPEVEVVKAEEKADGEMEAKDPVPQDTLDPALMKYVKMLQFGVPMPAVKLKMEQENVLPSLHDLVLNYNR